jgi:hypothetical protein
MSCLKLLLLFIFTKRNNNNNTSNLVVIESSPPFSTAANNNSQNSEQNLHMIRAVNAVSNVCDDNYYEDSLNSNNSKHSVIEELT